MPRFSVWQVGFGGRSASGGQSDQCREGRQCKVWFQHSQVSPGTQVPKPEQWPPAKSGGEASGVDVESRPCPHAKRRSAAPAARDLPSGCRVRIGFEYAIGGVARTGPGPAKSGRCEASWNRVALSGLAAGAWTGVIALIRPGRSSRRSLHEPVEGARQMDRRRRNVDRRAQADYDPLPRPKS